MKTNRFEFDNDVEEKEIDLLEYWAVIRKRKWMVIAFAGIVFLSVTIFTFLKTPTYKAEGTILIEKEPNILTFEELFQIETFRDDYLQTQYRLLENREVAKNVIDLMNLYEHEEFVGKRDNGKEPVDRYDPIIRRRLTDSLLGRLEVTPVRMTRLVNLSFVAQDPRFAADVLNAYFDAYIDWSIEYKYAATEQASQFLEEQIENINKEIKLKEEELQDYGVTRNIIALSDTETTIIDKLGELNKALTEAQIERMNKEAYYNEIKIASSDFIPDAMTNPVIQRLRGDYFRLNREYIKKQELFREDYPELKRLKKEIESAKEALEAETQNIIKGAASDYQAALGKEKSLEEAFNKQKLEAQQLESSSIQYNSLKIEIENKKNLLESLLRRHSETGIAARLKGLRTSNIKVVNRAEIPIGPSSPKKKTNLILALLVGILGGVGLAFIFEYLDNSVKTSEDVEKYAKMPTLGVVPTFSEDGIRKGYGFGIKRDKNPKTGKNPGTKPKVKSIDLIPYFSPQSGISECYRSIRTALFLSAADGEVKAIGISSPLPKEGKSATAANLAVTFAQANKNVLIVDTDLHKPRLHRIFKIKNINGLTNYLTGKIEIKELIKKTEVPNLFLVNSGPVPPNPAELLGSKKMNSFIRASKQSFDYVLFDMPPMLSLSDALVLGSEIDGMLLIVWGEKTSREALMRAKEKLDLMNIKTLGVVINNLNISKNDYYYKHYYYHYYGDGYYK